MDMHIVYPLLLSKITFQAEDQLDEESYGCPGIWQGRK